MPTFTFDYSTDAERLALEQMAAYMTDLRNLARHAPDGTVLDACEQLVLDAGRAALRATLQAALQTRAHETDAAKKKSPAPARKAHAPAG
jgi:hypothetical protein